MVAGVLIQRERARRPRPMNTPKMNPRMMAGIARRKVPPANLPMLRKPSRIRNAKLLNTTWRFVSKLPSGALGDHPGNRKAPFNSRHDRGDSETEGQVNESSGGQGVNRLRRLCFELARVKG